MALPEVPGFNVVRKIGTGSYGDVHEAHKIGGGALVAVKSVNKALLRQPGMIDRLVKEIEIQSQLRHPNVVSLLEYFEDDGHVYLATELCEGGELLTHLQARGRLPAHEAAPLFRQLVEAVAYLHSNGVMHRDLKLANVLLASEGLVKLCDFGLASVLDSSDAERHTICGTPNYLSPELVAYAPYTMATDLWSLGVVLFALLVGRPPFQSATVQETLRLVGLAEYEIPPGMDPAAADLVRALLQRDPKKRMPLARVLEHQFLAPALPGGGCLVSGGGRARCGPGEAAEGGARGEGWEEECESPQPLPRGAFPWSRGAAALPAGNGGAEAAGQPPIAGVLPPPARGPLAVPQAPRVGGGRGGQALGLFGSLDATAGSLRESALFRASASTAEGGGDDRHPMRERAGPALPPIDLSAVVPIDHVTADGALSIAIAPGEGIRVTHRATGATFAVSPCGGHVEVSGAALPGAGGTPRRYPASAAPAALRPHCGERRSQNHASTGISTFSSNVTGLLAPDLFAAAAVEVVRAATPRVVYLGQHAGAPTRACLMPSGHVEVVWEAAGPCPSPGAVRRVRTNGPKGGWGIDPGGSGVGATVTLADGRELSVTPGGEIDPGVASAVTYAARCQVVPAGSDIVPLFALQRRCEEVERRAGGEGAHARAGAGPLVVRSRGGARKVCASPAPPASPPVIRGV